MVQNISEMTLFEKLSNQQARQILTALSIARSPVPLDYISIHTRIAAPYQIIKILEKQGLVRRIPPSSWSSCGHPMFKITTSALAKAHLF